MDYSVDQYDNTNFSLKNISFQTENISSLINFEEELWKWKNPYITKDHIPELEIIDKNTIIFDKKI